MRHSKHFGNAILLALAAGACDSPTSAPRASVSIDGPPAIQFASLGESRVLSVSVRDGNPADVVWRSTNARAAGVDRSGVVTAVADGEAFVIASIGSLSDTVRVTVMQIATGARFLTEPEHGVLGEPLTVAIRVAVIDALGAPVGAFPATVTLSLTGGGGLDGAASHPLVNGVAEFDDLRVTTAGAGYRLNAQITSSGGPSLTAQSIAFDIVETPDLVILRGASSQSGILVDGLGAGGALNDRGYVLADSSLHVVLRAAPESNEIIAFTRTRPPVVSASPWTDAPDTVAVQFPATIAVPVTIWIVRGPYASVQQRAAAAVATTLSIWNAERMGVVFSDVEYVDATANPDASSLFDQTLCNQQARTTTSIGTRAGRINIYYVATVDGGSGRGRACGSSFIIMGEQSGHELLSHEIGHSFGLGHVDGDSRYDQTNVMHSASNVRQYLTEGQIFRSHFNSFSALRSVYAARTDAPRNCADPAGSTACPSLERRLWPDGSFPSDMPAGSGFDSMIARFLFADCDVGEIPADEALRSAPTVGTETTLIAVIESRMTFPADVRLRAVQGLARIGGPRSIAPLARLATDSSAQLAAAARAALAAIDSRSR